MKPELRKMLMTIRAALIMMVKAIEEYCAPEIVKIQDADTLT